MLTQIKFKRKSVALDHSYVSRRLCNCKEDIFFELKLNTNSSKSMRTITRPSLCCVAADFVLSNTFINKSTTRIALKYAKLIDR